MATELATELMHELKANAKRWFIAFVVMVVLEVLTIAGFIAYCALPVEESKTVQMENDSGDANYVGGDNVGEINNGKN